MNRRRFIVTSLTGAVAAPSIVDAQARVKMSRIGYLGPCSPAVERNHLDAFQKVLRDLGHVEGRNVTMEYRWAQGDDTRLPALAVELVHLKPDVIVTSGTPGALAASKATKTIPIVMATSAFAHGAYAKASLS
jgi:putative ABC transport system substrate-binding protein